MFGFLRGILWGALLVGAGWLVGSAYPAPPMLTAAFKQRSDAVIARIDLSPAALQHLRAQLSAEDFSQLSRDAATLAAAAGHAVPIERDDEARGDAEDVTAPAPLPVPADGGPFQDVLLLCPKMTISNAPPADAQGRVSNFMKIANISGVPLAVNPTHGACLSSAFGPRNGRTHEGVDFYSADGGPIMAAADGTVIEKKYRDDYGNMLLIDHGMGVYTRYAHLSSFTAGVDVGTNVSAGQIIGLMGNTAGYRIPIHLHYEVLLGDYNNPKASFGLTPESPFQYAALK